ncbi:proteasome assembly chaperone family protein [Candidatus Micrarchaeota archaeon]|nr:proteasome assembly chaperone family protein [Candidatus Micrarchaeota archaeon]
MEVKIILDKKAELKDHVLVEGFPGIGLVGTIAAGYLVEKRKMIPIGHIYSDAFPPMTSIHNGRPYFPARIYKDPNANFCVLMAEFVVPSNAVHMISNEILRFIKDQKIRQVVSLAGMTSAKEDEKRGIYGIASNDEMAAYLKLKKVPLINEGVTTGVSGVLIAQCAVENFPAMSLLVESKSGEPDPRAASDLLKKLENVIGLKVDTADLLSEAGRIEAQMGKMMEQVKKGKRVYARSEKAGEVPMYQ